ncbi:TRAP transporter small permease [Parasulfitobacter algicola]|uniref:TRAP transporter small permease protein n=1 Tax=Parasulfitobacter algicola TaxID=2614809 RepID=A0ABX2IUP3_9RHOB|nr:TRAP transporter small permease [Sulfitobacter algicola]NSX54775.1 TRAP transporter small permease [Sulfitobacter algicola]
MALAKATQERVGVGIEIVARWFAYTGGLILACMAVMTVVSIIGRSAFSQGIPGDYELVEHGCALAVFLFLPLCQLKRGHVTVDILVDAFPARIKALFGFLGDLLIAVAAVVILRQFWFGFGEKVPFGSDAVRNALGMGYKPFFPETTYELEIPIWMLYGAALLGAVLFVIVSLYTVWRSLNWVLDGREGTL